MSTSSVNRQELLVRDLVTSSVTLYPSNALVVRELEVELKPGQNEIEIYGLSPTVDESSVKLDGHGAATVTDLTVDLVVNREKFADVYLNDVSDPEDSDSHDDMDPEDDDTEEVRQLRKEIKDLDTQHRSLVLLANIILPKRTEALDVYVKTAEAKDVKSLEVAKSLDAYQQQRLDISRETIDAQAESEELRKELKKKREELHVADRDSRRRERKQKRAFEKKKQTKQRKRKEKVEAKRREREVMLKFWPKKVYKIVVHLDTAVDTPGSSRRTSVTSATLAKSPGARGDEHETWTSPRKVSLELSYVTRDAFWKPAYDITIGTEKKTGLIVYRAEFENKTSETWKDTKLWLSTSHTQFGGLDEKVPWMHRWTIGLSKHSGTWNCLRSWEENSASANNANRKAEQPTMNRGDLFGDDGSNDLQEDMMAFDLDLEDEEEHYQPRATQSAMRPRTYARGTKRSAPAPVQAYEEPQASLESSKDESRSLAKLDSGLRMSAMLGNGPPIDYEDTSFEDHGLTTTYEVPGSRTLEPSALTRRHKIASLPVPNMFLSTISVPKLRAAAFLRARLRNSSSSITLLKGSAGITLDGTYLGSQTLPRTAPGEIITLALGVDPAVHVSYAKPTVRRSTQGIVPFNKAASQVYTREMVISNSKNVAIDLMVIDQIPVSEDERLRVEVVTPKGLTGENISARTGKPVMGRVAGSGNIVQPADEKKWGKADATLREDGKIEWTVTLEKGCACSLPFEYEIKAPSSESVHNK